MRSFIAQGLALLILGYLAFGVFGPWFSNTTFLPGPVNIIAEVLISIAYLWTVGEYVHRLHRHLHKPADVTPIRKAE